jgi:hypothetical protein
MRSYFLVIEIIEIALYYSLSAIQRVPTLQSTIEQDKEYDLGYSISYVYWVCKARASH